MWILEEHIENNLIIFEKEEQIEKLLTDFSKANPEVAAFLLSEDTDILKDEEKEYFVFLISFYWNLINEHCKNPQEINSNIAEIADENWNIILNRGATNFRESLNSIFEIYPETEALAFLEDSLELDANDFLSTPGRDYIFVMIKSMLDYFLIIR